MKAFFLSSFLFSGFFLAPYAFAHHAPSGEIAPGIASSTQALHRFTSNEETIKNIVLPISTFSSLIAGDVGTDDVPELLLASGPGEQATVTVLRQDGSVIRTFHPFPTTNLNGLSVAVGNVQGDESPEIIAGHWAGETSTVALFSNTGEALSSFSAFNPSFLGGVSLATIRLPGEAHDLIVVGAGVGGGPHVRLFTANGNLHSQFFAEDAQQTGGINVAAINTDAPTLLTAPFSSGDPVVRAWQWSVSNGWQKRASVRTYQQYPYGVSLLPETDSATFTTLPLHGYGGAHERSWNIDRDAIAQTKERFLASASTTDRSLCTRVSQQTFCLFTKPILLTSQEKTILVNKTTAQLTAYQYGFAFRRFLVSIGLGNLTPTGTFVVQKKKPWHDYVRFYGAGDARNYSFKNVEFNLQFKPSYYIHYAYWHKNWGHKMSHGCVNAPYEGVKWLYEWADKGTPVLLQTFTNGV